MAAALSGVLQVLIFPLPAWSFLCWVALVPLMVAVLRSPKKEILSPGQEAVAGVSTGQAFWLGYLCGFIWYLGSCYWVFHVMHGYGGLSAPVAAGVLVLFCLYLGLYHGMFAALLARTGRSRIFAGARVLWVAPFLWVAVELARSRITGFPWDLLGTAQVENVPLSQLATITGVYGVSFVIALVNAGFAGVALMPKKKLRAVLALAAAIVLQAGIMFHPEPAPVTHTARLVQQNLPIANAGWTAEYFDRTIAELADLSRQPKTRNGSQAKDWSAAPRLIIWPESPAPFYVNDPKFNTWLATLASDQDAFILAGSLGLRNPKDGGDYDIFNSAVLVAPSGAFMARYDKVHLVPFGEYVPFQSLLFFAKNLTRQVGTFSRGSERTVFQLPASATKQELNEHQHHEGMVMPPAPTEKISSRGYKAGAFICYESVFPDEVRQFAQNGAQVFINLSNDGWFGETGAPGQHLNMARMRAVENNRWLLRATNTGITGSIDPYGRVVARAERNQRLALNAPYAMLTETTYYTRHGDVFAYLCAIISLLVAFVRFRLQAAVLRST